MGLTVGDIGVVVVDGVRMAVGGGGAQIVEWLQAHSGDP